MKKIIISITVITFVALMLIFIQLYSRSSKNKLLPTVLINNVEYQTTGSISLNDSERQLASRDAIKLISKGSFENEHFRFTLPGNGTLKVEIYSPYESNQQFFLNWLKENGYTHISPDQFDFIYLP